MSEPQEQQVETPAAPEETATFEEGSVEAALAAMLGVEEPGEAEEVQETPAEPQEAPQEAPPAQTPPAAPPPPAQDEQRLLTRIAEKEREMRAALQREQEAIQAAQAQLEAQQAKIREWEEFERRLSEEDVLGALESRGWKLEELAQAAVQGRGAAPLRRVEQQLKEQREAIERRFQELEAAKRQEVHQAQLRAAEAEVQSEVQRRSPLLHAAGAVGHNAVFALAQTFKAEGKPLSYDTLIPEAEQSLASLIESVLSVPANRERFLKAASTDSQAKRSPTLSNSVASQATRRTQRPNIDDIPDKDAAIDALFEAGSPFV